MTAYGPIALMGGSDTAVARGNERRRATNSCGAPNPGQVVD